MAGAHDRPRSAPSGVPRRFERASAALTWTQKGNQPTVTKNGLDTGIEADSGCSERVDNNAPTKIGLSTRLRRHRCTEDPNTPVHRLVLEHPRRRTDGWLLDRLGRCRVAFPVTPSSTLRRRQRSRRRLGNGGTTRRLLAGPSSRACQASTDEVDNGCCGLGRLSEPWRVPAA